MLVNKRWIHFCIIAGLALLYFRVVYLHPHEMMYSSDSDLIRDLRPQHSFMVEALKRDGEVPLWLPWRWSGTPFQANPLSAIYYPVNWLLFPISPDHSYGYFFMIHAVIAGIFMYMYLAEIGLGRPAGLLGAILYMFGGAAFSMYFYQLTPHTFSWLALLLFLAERIVRYPSIYYAVLMALIAAIQFLGCHTQFFSFGMCLLSCYFLWIIFLRPAGDTGGRRLLLCGYLMVSCALFVALVAVQLLPALELSRYLSRRGGLSFYEASYPLFYPWKLWRCVCAAPGESPSGGIYFGFGISMLALWGMVLSKRRSKLFFAVFALVSAIYSMGKLSPLFYLCYKLLPPLRYFRDPARSLWIFSYSWIVLASLGLDSLLNGAGAAHSPDVSRRRSVKLACAAILISVPAFVLNTSWGQRLAMKCARCLYLLAHFSSPFDAHLREVEEILSQGAWMSLQLLIFIAATYLLLYLIVRRSSSFRRKVIFPLIAIAVTGELFFMGRGLETIRPEVLYEETEPVRFIRSQSGRYRVLGMGTPRPLPQFLAARYGIELVDGYSPSVLADYVNFTNRAASIEEKKAVTKLPLTDKSMDDIKNNNFLDLLNVRFILSLEPSEKEKYRLRGTFRDVPLYRQFKGIVPAPDYYVYENTTALPRAFIVPRAKVVSDREELLCLVGEIDPRKVVLLEREAGAATGEEPFRSVPYASYRPNEIELHVETDHPAYLVLSEIWYPGWKAFDNGREKEVLRVNYLLRGIFLEAGDHTVVFRFQPASYEIGRLVSLAALAVSAGAVLVSFRKR